MFNSLGRADQELKMKTDNLTKFVTLRRRLTEERLSLQSRIKQLDEALGAITPVSMSAVDVAIANAGAASPRKGKRTMSSEARARIAAAQRARWAKQKRGNAAPAKAASANGEAKPKRKMSAAGRKAISDAAKRRWAAARGAGMGSL